MLSDKAINLINTLVDLNYIYLQDIKTRHLLFKDVDFRLSKFYWIKSFLLAILLIVKVLIAKILPNNTANKKSKTIGLSWARLHTQRLKDKEEEIEDLIEYFYSHFSYFNICLYKKVPLLHIFKIASNLKIDNYSLYEKEYFYDSIFYRILFLIDYYVFKNIIDTYEPENIFCAGLCDRLAIILTELGQTYGVKIHMMQHGLLSQCKGKIKRKVHAFYYLYDFSIKSIKYSINLDTSPRLVYLPKTKGALKLKKFDVSPGQNIAYATAIVKHEFNEQIIETTINLLPDNFNFLIYVHPLDKIKKYEIYSKKKNVFIFKKERHSNLDYLISRLSTLGIEYHEFGVPSIFVNLDKLDGDFFHLDAFTTFLYLKEYEQWLKEYFGKVEIIE